MPPILLILDLDETLIHATDRPRHDVPAIFVGPHVVIARPHLREFLLECGRHFQLAVWSAGGPDYVAAIIRAVFPPEISLAFAWSRERCVLWFDPEGLEYRFVKDLKKVKRIGFDLDRVLIVDDLPGNARRNFGNAVTVAPFEGDPHDNELPRLARYLGSLRDAANVRAIEKRGWRDSFSLEPQDPAGPVPVVK